MVVCICNQTRVEYSDTQPWRDPHCWGIDLASFSGGGGSGISLQRIRHRLSEKYMGMDSSRYLLYVLYLRLSFTLFTLHTWSSNRRVGKSPRRQMPS